MEGDRARDLIRVARRWLLPGGAVLLLCSALIGMGDDGLLRQITGQYRWIVYGATAALAVGFHRSRVFTAVLGLGTLDLVTGGVTEIDALGPLGSVFIFAVGLLALSRDRGIASSTGAAQVGGTTLLAVIPGLIFYDSVNVDTFLALELLPTWTTAWTGYPQSVALVAVVALGVAGYSAYRHRGVVEGALIWCQLTVLVAMHPMVGYPADAFLLMASGVTLSLAVLQTTYAMAYHDDLTGLPARRALMRDLEEMGGTFTAAMVDVDHFKLFNDKHGHDVGDQVLKLVAAQLARTQGSGKAYRYGGEEFTILYPGKASGESLEHLEAVRGAVERATFSLRSWTRPREKPSGRVDSKRSKNLSVTVSIGVADSADGDVAAETVLKKADQALYRAKKNGRNQVSA